MWYSKLCASYFGLVLRYNYLFSTSTSSHPGLGKINKVGKSLGVNCDHLPMSLQGPPPIKWWLKVLGRDGRTHRPTTTDNGPSWKVVWATSLSADSSSPKYFSKRKTRSCATSPPLPKQQRTGSYNLIIQGILNMVTKITNSQHRLQMNYYGSVTLGINMVLTFVSLLIA